VRAGVGRYVLPRKGGYEALDKPAPMVADSNPVTGPGSA